MKIILIGPGIKPIPPKGWGAVESVVWDYYVNLKKQKHNVIILNDKNLQNVINKCNIENPDIIHIMYDDHIKIAPFLNCKIIIYTSHFAYITHPLFKTKYSGYYLSHFKQAITHKNKIYIFAISEQIRQLFIQDGFPEEKIFLVHNGAREEEFIYKEICEKPNKSIYLAKIEQRKRQYVYQTIESIDFAGNYSNSPFDIKRSNYLGEWTKPVLYKNLTNYANLVLLSDGEADPLVTKEALIAGLGVVVSECASANLDRTLPFINVIPDNKLNDLDYIKEVVERNRIQSVKNRKKIREYALNKFSWENVVKLYLKTINENINL